jgi:hypothetical protein
MAFSHREDSLAHDARELGFYVGPLGVPSELCPGDMLHTFGVDDEPQSPSAQQPYAQGAELIGAAVPLNVTDQGIQRGL